jgi:hypothetical protein
MVDEEAMGLHDLMFLPNFATFATLRTLSELLHEEVKHDLVCPEAMTMSIADSIM